MLNLHLSGTAVLLGVAMLVSLLMVVRVVIGRRLRRPPERGECDPGARTKYRGVDVFRYRPQLLRLGLICSLALALLAFNWTRYEPAAAVAPIQLGELADLDQAPPITRYDPPPPPPPPPPKYEATPDPELLDTVVFGSRDIDARTPVPPPRFGKPAVPPPPPSPPPIQHDGGEVVVIAEEMPVFGDCAAEPDRDARKTCSDRAIIQFINQHVRYPALARENDVSGTAVVRFVVEKDGSLTDVHVIRDPGTGLGAEALRVVELMAAEAPRWRPGKQRGRPVRVQFNLPVRFTLR